MKKSFCAILIASICALPLGGCFDDAAKAQEAAEWLRTYTAKHPPNDVWRTKGITVPEKMKIQMTVEVPVEKHARRMQGLSGIQKSKVVQLACPPVFSKYWSIAGDNVELWVHLQNTSGQDLLKGKCVKKMKG